MSTIRTVFNIGAWALFAFLAIFFFPIIFSIGFIGLGVFLHYRSKKQDARSAVLAEKPTVGEDQ